MFKQLCDNLKKLEIPRFFQYLKKKKFFPMQLYSKVLIYIVKLDFFVLKKKKQGIS